MNSPVWDTPWKISNEVRRLLVQPFVRFLFFTNGIAWGSNWRFYGIPIIQKHRHSRMHFGSGLHLRSSLRSNPLAPNHPVILATWKEGSQLFVGSNFAMTGGAICSALSITIGDRVVIGANTIIADTDFHLLDPERRWDNPSEGLTAPVVIQDNVFIGMNCLVLKGVTIGCDSVIGAGSVVVGDIPPRVIAAGNPARIIRQI